MTSATDRLSVDQLAKNHAQRQQTIAHYQKILSENLDSLVQAFEAGTPITEIVHARAEVMDLMLNDIWQMHFSAADNQRIALVAVGGYGRGELHPKSDIDIMLLLADDALEQYRPHIEAMITLLWDLKLDIGHSVRTCADCAKEASKDVTVVTNLMEARLLAGSDSLFSRMRAAIGESQIWSKEDFFKAKLAEQQQRHQKIGDTAYRLEPNVKEAPGGLRDIQTIFWVAKRYFNAERLEDLTTLGFLTTGELQQLLKGRELLWEIRFNLHIVANRREERLLFDHQLELAKLFNFHDQNHNLAVEQFMQNYYRTVTELERLNEMLLQLLQEAIEHPDNTTQPQPINQRFDAIHGYLQAKDAQIFIQYPPALLEVFLLMQRHPELKGVGAKTIRLIRNHRHLINHAFRHDVINRDLFMAILKEPHGISHELRRMNRYGVLAAYLPEFENIVGRMQYDLFHIYTVDVHTLFVLRNLRRFSVPEHAQWQPDCSKIFPTLQYPEILYIAALFHDIAKGRGGDHSQLGAEDAEKFCRNHQLNTDITQTVTWLVENHLLMSMTAQRKDIADPDIIHEFALQLGDQNRLDYLYLLTVADISATNPELLSSWRSRLLLELYSRTRYVFRHGLAKPVDASQRIQERQAAASTSLTNIGIERAGYQTIWNDFGDDYFLRHTVEEIVWHTAAIAKTAANDLPLVLIQNQITRGATPIFIYAAGTDGFFAVTTCVLARLGLNIVDARIITSNTGYTLDTYLVLDAHNQPIMDTTRINEIQQKLSAGMQQREQQTELPQWPIPRQLQHFHTPTRITTEDDPEGRYTLLEIITADRPGLLAIIGQALQACEIYVHNAKISTIGEQAENIFLIADRQKNPIREPQQLQHLSDTLHNYIDADEQDNHASEPTHRVYSI